MTERAVLAVHGGAGSPPPEEHPDRDAAVRRALAQGWERIGEGALEAVIAAVRRMEDEPTLNAGIGACLNRDGEIELDAAVMDGTSLRTGAAGAVRDVRHPIDLARAIMDDGRHVLLVAGGASLFAREHGLEMADPGVFMTERQRRNLAVLDHDTVGAVARDRDGRTAVAVSTGGVTGKLPGRLGDSPLAGAGFYADDRAGAFCGTGQGEGFIRLALARLAIVELEHGMGAQEVADGAVRHLLKRVGMTGGVILVDAHGRIGAAHNTPYMAWATQSD